MDSKKIEKFIRNAVRDLSATDSSSTYYLQLDADFAVYVGWSAGFDPKDEGLIHSQSQPGYCICSKVAEWNPGDIDYGWMFMPWYRDTGEVWDNEVTISTDENFYETARWLNKNYRGMRKALRDGEITFND